VLKRIYWNLKILSKAIVYNFIKNLINNIFAIINNNRKIKKYLGNITMQKWKQIGKYYDMIVEENGKKRRLIDITGKVITEYDI